MMPKLCCAGRRSVTLNCPLVLRKFYHLDYFERYRKNLSKVFWVRHTYHNPYDRLVLVLLLCNVLAYLGLEPCHPDKTHWQRTKKKCRLPLVALFFSPRSIPLLFVKSPHAVTGGCLQRIGFSLAEFEASRLWSAWEFDRSKVGLGAGWMAG